MVADVSAESPDQTPVFLSRNVKARTLTELHGRVSDTLSDDEPFGKKCVLLVFKSTKALVVDGQADWSSILGTNVYTNRILRP